MQIIKDFLQKYQIKDTDFVIGVSGGADSLALALMFKEEFPNYNLIALTVDHMLRPTSGHEAQYVAQVMKQHHIEHHILTWEGEKPKTGIEEKAREERYRLICNWCSAHEINNLVMAHHLLDQAETFFMRLQRGSGLFGLSCMEDIFYRNNIKILRPFLDIHPDDLKKYLLQRGIQWVEDESNQCTDYLRVKVRKFLPQITNVLGITPNKISTAIRNLQGSKRFISDYVENIILQKVHNWENIAFSFDVAEYNSWHPEIKFTIINRLLTRLSNSDYPLLADSLLKLIKDMDDSHFENATLGGCHIVKSDLRFWLITEIRKKNKNISNIAWDLYLSENPQVRGLKIPVKLKIALLNQKNHKK